MTPREEMTPNQKMALEHSQQLRLLCVWLYRENGSIKISSKEFNDAMEYFNKTPSTIRFEMADKHMTITIHRKDKDNGNL